jgi:hypothetical protein
VLILLWGASFWVSGLVRLSDHGPLLSPGYEPLGEDFIVFYAAGTAVREGKGHTLYDRATQRVFQRAALPDTRWHATNIYMHPPFNALLFAPLSLLPYFPALALWSFLGLGTVWLALRSLGVVRPARALVILLCFYPMYEAAKTGQTTFFAFAVTAATYLLWARGKSWGAGLMGGLLFFKPQLLVGIGVLFALEARRDPRPLLGMSIAGAGLLAVSLLFLPEATESFFSWMVSVFVHQEPVWDRLTPPGLYTLRSFATLLLGERQPAVPLLTGVLGLAGLAGFLLCWRRFRDARTITFGAALTLSLWLSPHLHIHDWGLLALPAILLWAHLPNQRRQWLGISALVWIASAAGWLLALLQFEHFEQGLHPAMPALAVSAVLVWRALPGKQRSASLERSRLGSAEPEPSQARHRTRGHLP